MVDLVGIVLNNPQAVFIYIALVLILAYIRESRGTGFSIPFGLITAALLIMIWSFLPEWLVGVAELGDYTIGTANALSILFFAIAAAGLIWAVIYTLRRDSTPKPETVADHVFKKYGQVVDSYARIIGLLGIFVLFFGYAFLSNFAEVFGQLGNIVAMEPFLTSNIITALAGWAALGGEIPIIGEMPVLRSLGPTGWLGLAVLLVAAAAMAAYSSRGQTSRLFR